jgi:tetratricopeptide (TPR) repeat protein
MGARAKRSQDTIGSITQPRTSAISWGEYEEAFQAWQSALKIYQEVKDRAGESKVLNNLGIAYYSLGQFTKAVPLFQQRLTISRELNDRQAEAYALDSLGLNYIQLGQYKQAIAFYQ